MDAFNAFSFCTTLLTQRQPATPQLIHFIHFSAVKVFQLGLGKLLLTLHTIKLNQYKQC